MINKVFFLKNVYHSLIRYFACKWLSLFHPIQIGITGSQGKTNTTEIVTKVLEKFGNTVRTDIKLDTTYNVPITALRVRPYTEFIVWELGIDHPGEMDHHHEIASPSISCVTGISSVHTDKEHMGSMEVYIKEKRKIIEHLNEGGTAVLNFDNKYTKSMAGFTKANVLFFGSSKDCDFYIDQHSITVDLEGTKGTCYFRDKNSIKKLEIKTGLIGAFHFYNIACSFLLVQSALPDKDISKIFINVVSKLKPLAGRMSVDQGPLDTVLLNDSLRANPESTKAGLETLSSIDYKKGRKIAVIGEMGELEDPEKEHRDTGRILKNLNIDYIICIGKLRKFTIDQALKDGLSKDKIHYANNLFDAYEFLKNFLKKDDLWYLKGSLLRNYNRILKLLNGEDVCCHETLCPYEHCK